ncbi:MAG TPA: hypothetical protein VGQ05_19920 [Streptosporangiaceae bacterium]|nr:hypothetical protein [Streptosporangiaceae bacterium]
MAETGVQISPAVADRLREAAERDGRLSAGAVTRLAQQAVAAWASAVDGDDRALAALGGPDAASWLTQPVNSKSTRLSPGARVTAVEISGVDADRSPARLDVRFEFTGRWQQASDGDDTDFVGFLNLDLDGAGPQPWRLTAGYLQRLSSWLGYQFTSRRETPEEHQRRTGSAAVPAPAAGQGRTFRLTAGFAEHDERYGGSASVQVSRPTPPSRAEAEALIRPAIEAAAEQALGPGDWYPSLNWLEVTELLG